MPRKGTSRKPNPLPDPPPRYTRKQQRDVELNINALRPPDVTDRQWNQMIAEMQAFEQKNAAAYENMRAAQRVGGEIMPTDVPYMPRVNRLDLAERNYEQWGMDPREMGLRRVYPAPEPPEEQIPRDWRR
jgi:hypothetical protein